MGDITDSHLAWKTRKGVPRNSSFLVVDDLLFMAADNGVVSCLDSTNGEVKWVKRVRKLFFFSFVCKWEDLSNRRIWDNLIFSFQK